MRRLVSKILLSGQVLRRFVEQIIEHTKEEEEVFSLLPVLGCFQQQFNSASWSRTMLCRSGGAVLRQDRARCPRGNLVSISLSPVSANTRPRVQATVNSCFCKNFPAISLSVDPNPEVDRCSHLEILTILQEPLASGSHVLRFLRTVYGGFWKNFSNFLREGELGS